MGNEMKEITAVISVIRNIDGCYEASCHICARAWMCNTEKQAIESMIKHMKQKHKINSRYPWFRVSISYDFP